MLALVAVVLVDGAVLVAPAGVGQVTSHGALEEGLAALAGHLPVVLPAGLVAADDALEVLGVLAVLVDAVPVRALGHVGGGHAGGGGGDQAGAAVGEALDVAVLGLGVGRTEGLCRHDVVPGGGGDRGAGDHGVSPAGHVGRLGHHQRHLSLRHGGLKIFQTQNISLRKYFSCKIFIFDNSTLLMIEYSYVVWFLAFEENLGPVSGPFSPFLALLMQEIFILQKNQIMIY